jgi:2-polyprenyl-3-methyl-5-hydroxy-6-metoxy-1,4-benzoquinol methylase
VTRNEIARLLAARYESRYLRGYVRAKVASDPVYEAVAERLRDHALPLIDLGCGVGLMAFYLREKSFRGPITGIDFDERKIAVACAIAERHALNVDFRTGDARAMLPVGHSVMILDLLQYMDRDGQQLILRNAARAVAPGGVVIIRAGIRDRSWRYRLSWLSDTFGRAIRWMRAERLKIPTRDDITAPFAEGFDSEITPLWGRTPFNNYLFVFRRR